MEVLEGVLDKLPPAPVGIPQVADQSDLLSWFLFLVQWSAIVLSALAGMSSARRHGMDFFGALVIAFIACTGGGTIRDMLLGDVPVFWLRQPAYAITVLVIAVLFSLVAEEARRGQEIAVKVAQPVEQMASAQTKTFITIDALALGLWAYLGTYYALYAGVPVVIAPIMGIVTASFGSVLRDVFFARVPQLFVPGQLYAIAAGVGAVAFVIFWSLGSPLLGFLACFLLTFLTRMISVRFNIQSR